MKAIVFDLFETLITEWGRPKYLTSDVAFDLDVDEQAFGREWRALGRERFLGQYAKPEAAYKKILDNLGIDREDKLLIKAAQKRIQHKNACFDRIEQAVIEMLLAFKSAGYKIGLISNCSPEEVEGLQACELYPYFDVIVLSCDVGLEKPDVAIYEHCLSLLGVKAVDCYFVGDGGSNELFGAEQAGMKPLRAWWFTKHFVENFDSDKSYKAFYEPEELVKYVLEEKMSIIKTHDIWLEGSTGDYEIVLRPLTDEHLPYLYKWNADPEVLYWTEGDTADEDLSYDAKTVNQIYGGVSQQALCFLIEANERPIGECWLQKMNLPDVSAMYAEELDVRRIDFSIGEKAYWNKGIGTKFVGMLIDYAFTGECVDVLHCFSEDYNVRSCRMWEKHGFERIFEEPLTPQPQKGKWQYHWRLTKEAYVMNS